MSDPVKTSYRSIERFGLGAILLLFGVLSTIGITWGLPSREIDKYLFGQSEPWSGEKIYRLAGAPDRNAPGRGADVDIDPLDKSSDAPIFLNATDEDVAEIYLRYRLYTNQPDEMITMMALSGMSPRELKFDPKLYQYGGLFIYPVGALIGLGGALGVIEVRSDVVYYLDHPEEFGKFYVVARAYAALWGMVGVVVVFAIARRLKDHRAGLLAALLFTLMPVVVCMAHEGKPHLPGAVLMLLAVLFAMRFLQDPLAGRARNWWLMCVACGAALGMVLSSLPIFVLIPLVAWLSAKQPGAGPLEGDGKASAPTQASAVRQTLVGLSIASAVYLITNPYIVINALANREVLASNFGNSFSMYDVSRLVEGFVRVLELTIEGGTLPILVVGVVALAFAVARRNVAMVPLAVPAAVLFAQFVLIGAGKPAEYGRFGVFANTALAIAAACLVAHRSSRVRPIVNWITGSIVFVVMASFGSVYLRNFYLDTTQESSRLKAAADVAGLFEEINGSHENLHVALRCEPAPYCCPPLNFSEVPLFLYEYGQQIEWFRLEDPAKPWESSTATTIEPVEIKLRPSDTLGPPSFFPEGLPILSLPELSAQVVGYGCEPDGWFLESSISWANKCFFRVTPPLQK